MLAANMEPFLRFLGLICSHKDIVGVKLMQQSSESFSWHHRIASVARPVDEHVDSQL